MRAGRNYIYRLAEVRVEMGSQAGRPLEKRNLSTVLTERNNLFIRLELDWDHLAARSI